MTTLTQTPPFAARRLWRLAQAIYLHWLNCADRKELLDRSKDGSSSSRWASEVAARCADRDEQIGRLLA
jgi:hypothetical protein